MPYGAHFGAKNDDIGPENESIICLAPYLLVENKISISSIAAENCDNFMRLFKRMLLADIQYPPTTEI
jgi:hypothetical protein